MLSATIFGSDPALAESGSAKKQIDLGPGTFAAVLAELARETGISVGSEEPLPTRTVPALRGRMSVDEALRRILARSGYVALRTSSGAYRISRAKTPARTSPTPAPRPGDLAPSQPPASGEPIVVTAGKRPQEIAGLPLSVTVVVPDDPWGGAGFSGTSDVAEQVDGLALTSLGAGRNRLYLRGVADSSFSGSTQSTVAVLLDDARVTWSAPDPDLQLIDVDRVEIVKGAQGAFYGTGALGGVYHVVTKRPELDEASATVTLGGRTNGSDARSFGDAVFNLPLIRDELAARLVAYDAREPGWISTGSRSEANVEHIRGGRAALRWQPNRWTVDLRGQVQRINTADSQYVYRPDTNRRPAQLSEPHDNDFEHIGFEISGPISALRLEVLGAVTWHGLTDVSDATIGGDQLGVVAPTLYADERDHRLIDAEARISGEWCRLSWIVGLARLNVREKIERRVSTSIQTDQLIERLLHEARDNALFAEATAPITPAISFTLGGRLFYASDRLEAVRGKSDNDRETVRTGLTPSASLSWRAGARDLLYVRYGSAIRPASIGLDRLAAGTSDDGDELQTFELGFHSDRVGRIALAAYYTLWNHLQSDTLGSDGLVAVATAGDAEILGVEASLSHPFSGGWSIEVGGTWQEAELSRNQLGFDLDDRRLPVVPKVSVRARITREFAVRSATAALTAQARYEGSSRLSFDPALDREMGETFSASVSGKIQQGPLSLGAQVENLFDSEGNRFSYGNPFRIRTASQFTPMAPRTLTLFATYAF